MPIRISLHGIDPLYMPGNTPWRPLYGLVERYELDIYRVWKPADGEQAEPAVKIHHARREDSTFWEDERTMETPAGPLTCLDLTPKNGSPGYRRKHYVETVVDAKKWLSCPLKKSAGSVESYFELEKCSGDRALLMVGIGDAIGEVHELMGSERLGVWLMEERDLLHEMVTRSFSVLEDLVKHYLSQGVGDCFYWGGPEICIPPLASPRDFCEFVVKYDRRISELVRHGGKLVAVHCHGDMGPVLEEFVEMGVNCLNPMEPTAGLTLAQAKKRAAGRMCLDGGVQSANFDFLEPDEMVRLVEASIAQGKPGGGYILCPTASPFRPIPNDRQIANYQAFVETGIRLADYS